MTTEITRKELELCAELLGYELDEVKPGGGATIFKWAHGVKHYTHFNPERDAKEREALARASGLRIDFGSHTVTWDEDKGIVWFDWDEDGTYEQCIVKAAAAVMRARKQP